MRILAALGLATVCLMATSAARAESGNKEWDGDYGAKAKRRSDFTLGMSGGFGFGKASGYPNEIDKLDDDSYRSSTGVGLDNGGAIWLGVAFNDYVSFGLGIGGLGVSGNDRKAGGGGFIFHVDTYPLFAMHRNLQDLGVFANVGAGGLSIEGGPEVADGGSMAYLEGGLVYERWRFWRIAMG
ncbi:MAG TPA: hypothetical protein VIW29_04100, partial [Polyangiaceae bacterium]